MADKKDKKKKSKKGKIEKVLEQEPIFKKSISISTMDTSVEILSEDPEDSLDDIRTHALEVIDKYRKR